MIHMFSWFCSAGSAGFGPAGILAGSGQWESQLYCSGPEKIHLRAAI